MALELGEKNWKLSLSDGVRSPSEEDARRAHRELGRLGHERSAHINRIRGLLVLNNVRVKNVGGRLW